MVTDWFANRRRMTRSALAVMVAAGVGVELRAQALAVRGSVVDQAGAAVPYATVRTVDVNANGLTNEWGLFALRVTAPGRYRVLVRQVGFMPMEANLEASPVAGIERDTIRLTRVALMLPTVTVMPDAPCTSAGYSSAMAGDVAELWSQARLNGERLRAVAGLVPVMHRYANVKRHFDARGEVVAVLTDTSVRSPTDGGGYVPGGVVQRVSSRRRDWNTRIPDVDVLADSAFLAVHCFRYAGQESADGVSVHRIDFRPLDSLTGPDVEGSFWLDVASLELRTATFRLVNPPRDIPGFAIAIAVGRLSDGRPVVQKSELRYGQNSRARFAGRPISLTTQSSVLLR